MKTRDEEIEAAAQNETTSPELCADCFKDGAKWADAHPSPEAKALVKFVEMIVGLDHSEECEFINSEPEDVAESDCDCLHYDAVELLANFNKARSKVK